MRPASAYLYSFSVMCKSQNNIDTPGCEKLSNLISLLPLNSKSYITRSRTLLYKDAAPKSYYHFNKLKRNPVLNTV
jgi:hypothetical protein